MVRARLSGCNYRDKTLSTSSTLAMMTAMYFAMKKVVMMGKMSPMCNCSDYNELSHLTKHLLHKLFTISGELLNCCQHNVCLCVEDVISVTALAAIQLKLAIS